MRQSLAACFAGRAAGHAVYRFGLFFRWSTRGAWGSGLGGWDFFAELPEELAEDAHPHDDVGAVDLGAEEEAAEVGGSGAGGMVAGVLAGFEDLGEEGEEAIGFGGGGGCGGAAGVGKGAGADELVEADGDGLAEIHRGMTEVGVECHGDGEEEMAVRELVVRETGFLGAKEEGDPVSGGFAGFAGLPGFG